MSVQTESSNEIFSFHLLKLSLWSLPRFLFQPVSRDIQGLKYAEGFLTMNLGEGVISTRRFNFKEVAMLAWWDSENQLDDFLKRSEGQPFREGWHVRLKLYRRWGEISELENAVAHSQLAPENTPVVAVTLARLNILETLRFARWGKPVEAQVRDHKGKTLALAGMRLFNTFTTFSIWRNEFEMLNMVSGRRRELDGESHKLAMKERVRKDFHFEFMTMRFAPIKESGTWNGQSNLTGSRVGRQRK